MTRGNAGVAHHSDKGPAPSAVRAELNRILASSSFNASTRKSRFLTHVVEEALAGHGDHLTAYDVAIAVFDRDERFDPQSDPLVRITARRVRGALDQYYLTSGRDNPLRIAIPKGHYRPIFVAAPGLPAASMPPEGPVQGADPAAGQDSRTKHRVRVLVAAAAMLFVSIGGAYLYVAPRWPWQNNNAVHTLGTTDARFSRQRILVPAVRNISADPHLDTTAQAITREITLSLCCTTQFQIVPPGSAADFELDGSVQKDASSVRAQFLVSGPTGKVLWTHTYVLSQPTDAGLADAGITGDIATQLVQLRGTRE